MILANTEALEENYMILISTDYLKYLNCIPLLDMNNLFLIFNISWNIRKIIYLITELHHISDTHN